MHLLNPMNPMNPGDRHAAGVAALQRLGGPDVAAPILAAADVAPDLVRFAIDFAFGEVLSRPGLELRTRELCTVAALSGLGHAEAQLKWHIDAALYVGATNDEVDQVKRIARGYARPSNGVADEQGPLDPVTRELATVASHGDRNTAWRAEKSCAGGARCRGDARTDRARPRADGDLRRFSGGAQRRLRRPRCLRGTSIGSCGSLGSMGSLGPVQWVQWVL